MMANAKVIERQSSAWTRSANDCPFFVFDSQVEMHVLWTPHLHEATSPYQEAWSLWDERYRTFSPHPSSRRTADPTVWVKEKKLQPTVLGYRNIENLTISFVQSIYINKSRTHPMGENEKQPHEGQLSIHKPASAEWQLSVKPVGLSVRNAISGSFGAHGQAGLNETIDWSINTIIFREIQLRARIKGAFR